MSPAKRRLRGWAGAYAMHSRNNVRETSRARESREQAAFPLTWALAPRIRQAEVQQEPGEVGAAVPSPACVPAESAATMAETLDVIEPLGSRRAAVVTTTAAAVFAVPETLAGPVPGGTVWCPNIARHGR